MHDMRWHQRSDVKNMASLPSGIRWWIMTE